MNILALDTSLDFCISALSQDGKVDAISFATQHTHADLILGQLSELLARNRLSLADLSAIAYVAGPARFTGVRIACSVCQALSLAKNIPVVQIPSLQLIAQSIVEQANEAPIVVGMDAFMGEVYWGIYEKIDQLMQPAAADSLLTPEAATVPSDCIMGIGDAWQKYVSLAKPKQIYPFKPRPDQLITLAQYHFAQHELLNAAAVLPIYLRSKEAWK